MALWGATLAVSIAEPRGDKNFLRPTGANAMFVWLGPEGIKSASTEGVSPGKEHHGRIVKTTGDGLLIEFAGVVDAVRCGVAVQRAMRERNTQIPAGR